MSGCLRGAPLQDVMRAQPVPAPLLLYFGLLGGMLLFMLGLFAFSREAYIGWYLGYLILLFIYQLFRANLAWRLGWPYSPWHETDLEFAAWLPGLAVYILFVRSFLQTPRYLKTIDRVLVAVAIAYFVYLPIVYVANRFFGIDLTSVALVPVTLIVIEIGCAVTASVLRVRMGYRPAAFFLLSYTWLFVFVSFALWQWVTHSSLWFGVYGAELGTDGECILLAFAIGDRLRLESSLRHVIATLPEVVLRVMRNGRVAFATPNAHELFGVPAPSLIGVSATSLVDGSDHLFRVLARKALHPGKRNAPIELQLRCANGETRRAEALVRADRDARGRVVEIQASLRDAPEREAIDVQPARIGDEREAANLWHLSIFGGRVESGGRAIPVTGRELELLAFLALRTNPVATIAIVNALWPDEDEHAASSTLQTTLSRLRKKLPPDAIVASKGGYTLRRAVIDTGSIGNRIKIGGILGSEELPDGISNPLPAALCKREWFAPYEVALENLRRSALVAMARGMIERGETDAALDIAAILCRLDIADESGYAIAVEAHMRADQPESARRVFDDCRRALERELGVKPSPELRLLCRADSN